jgi:hypothetical protein
MQPDLAAQKVGNFAADRETQSRPAVLAAGGSVRLLERFEDDLLFLQRDADTGVLHRERDDRLGAVQDCVVHLPALDHAFDLERDLAVLGEL